MYKLGVELRQSRLPVVIEDQHRVDHCGVAVLCLRKVGVEDVRLFHMRDAAAGMLSWCLAGSCEAILLEQSSAHIAYNTFILNT